MFGQRTFFFSSFVSANMANRDFPHDAPIPRRWLRTQPLPEPVVRSFVFGGNAAEQRSTPFGFGGNAAEQPPRFPVPPNLAAGQPPSNTNVIQQVQELSDGLSRQFSDMPDGAKQWVDGSLLMAQGGLNESQLSELEQTAQTSFAAFMAYLRSKNAKLDALPNEILSMIIQNLIRVAKIDPKDLNVLSMTNRHLHDILRMNNHNIWHAFIETKFPDFALPTDPPDELTDRKGARLKEIYFALVAFDQFWQLMQRLTNSRETQFMNTTTRDFLRDQVAHDKSIKFSRLLRPTRTAGQSVEFPFFKVKLTYMLFKWLKKVLRRRDFDDGVHDLIFYNMRFDQYVRLIAQNGCRDDSLIINLFTELRSAQKTFQGSTFLSNVAASGRQAETTLLIRDIRESIQNDGMKLKMSRPFDYIPDRASELLGYVRIQRLAHDAVEPHNRDLLTDDAMALLMSDWWLNSFAEYIASILHTANGTY